MIARKTIRESVGLTHEALKSDPEACFSLASSFYKATELLNEFPARIPSDSRPFVFNAALSLELIFKAILANKRSKIPQGANGHNLKLLCDRVGVAISENQSLTLELMTEELVWFARYPTPKQPEKFDEFHDAIFEKYIIRNHSGNVHSTRANIETFSNFENYKRIWEAAIAEFKA
jgi:hypothetical protein